MRFPEIDTLLVHIPKTGGTTITAILGKHLYPEELGEGRNVMKLYKRLDRVVVSKREKRAHVYAYQYRKAMGDRIYNKHYSFAFVRNPFEQIRSLYKQLTYMNIQQNSFFIPYKTMTFEEFVLGSGTYSMEGNSDLIDQEKYVKDRRRKEIIVDDVFVFDYYKESLEILEDKLGIPMDSKIKLRRTKSKKDTYTPEMASKVVDLYGHVYEFYKQAKKDFEQNVLSKT